MTSGSVDDGLPFPNIDLNDESEADEVNKQERKDQARQLRDELLSLSESGKIKHSVKYIKKAGHDTLEKIKMDYDRAQLEVTNELITKNLISKFSELMESFDLVDEGDQMGEKLNDNDLVKRDLKILLEI